LHQLEGGGGEDRVGRHTRPVAPVGLVKIGLGNIRDTFESITDIVCTCLIGKCTIGLNNTLGTAAPAGLVKIGLGNITGKML
jgi:hypothetical protein